MAHVVRRRVILDIREMFNAFDKDKNNSVTPDEFRAGMARLGFSLSKRAMTQLMQMLDVDKSGEIECVGDRGLLPWLRCRWRVGARAPVAAGLALPARPLDLTHQPAAPGVVLCHRRYREFVEFAQSQDSGGKLGGDGGVGSGAGAVAADPSPFAVASAKLYGGEGGTEQVSAELRAFLRHISQRTQGRLARCAVLCSWERGGARRVRHVAPPPLVAVLFSDP